MQPTLSTSQEISTHQVPTEVSVLNENQPAVQMITGRELVAKLQRSCNVPLYVQVHGMVEDLNINQLLATQLSVAVYQGRILVKLTDSVAQSYVEKLCNVYNHEMEHSGQLDRQIKAVEVYRVGSYSTWSELHEMCVKIGVDSQTIDDCVSSLHNIFDDQITINKLQMDNAVFPDIDVKVTASTSPHAIKLWDIEELMMLLEFAPMFYVVNDWDRDIIRTIIGMQMRRNPSSDTYERQKTIAGQQILAQFNENLKVPTVKDYEYDNDELFEYSYRKQSLLGLFQNLSTVIGNVGVNAAHNDLWLTVKTPYGESISGKFQSFNKKESMFGTYFTITLRSYTTVSGHLRTYAPTLISQSIEDFVCSDLEISPQQVIHGKTLLSLISGNKKPVSLDLKGHAHVPGFFGLRKIYHSGTVIYDPIGCMETSHGTWSSLISRNGMNTDNDAIIPITDNVITDEMLCSMDTSVIGFSLDKRQWIVCDLADTTPTVYDKTIIDKLVLPTREKQNIHAIVSNIDTGFSDIVAGKGGGAIFLLFGEPGLGKTLTAEAISALTESPLYKLSVGELGTDVESLENSLQHALNFATRWGATLLLDEADIFLEARDSNNIQRNAMVGVFLRLLEYYQGIMFLTTNRVMNFDQAFYSRITYSIAFHGQTVDDRKTVWNNLLTAAGINLPVDDVAVLATKNINNRQVKTCITNAQRFAMSEKVPVKIEHILRSLDSILAFTEEINKAKKSQSTSN